MRSQQVFYDTEPYWTAVSRIGSEKLLTALRVHHESSSPEPEEVAAPVEVEPEPVPASIPVVVLKPSCPQWFSIVEETRPAQPRIGDIKRAACQYFNIEMVDLDSARRTLKLVYPRQLVMFLAKTKTGKSLPEIGRRLQRDHTTVLHGVRKIERSVMIDWTVAYDVAQLEAMI
jgi:hypothetical protein